jgi:hypothetical protein
MVVFVFASKSFLEVEIGRDDYTASREDLGFLMWMILPPYLWNVGNCGKDMRCSIAKYASL